MLLAKSIIMFQKDKLRRRSIFVVKNIKKDEKFSNKNIKSIRPGFGMSPYHYNLIIEKKALVDLEVGTPLKPEFIKTLNQSAMTNIGAIIFSRMSSQRLLAKH